MRMQTQASNAFKKIAALPKCFEAGHVVKQISRFLYIAFPEPEPVN